MCQGSTVLESLQSCPHSPLTPAETVRQGVSPKRPPRENRSAACWAALRSHAPRPSSECSPQATPWPANRWQQNELQGAKRCALHQQSNRQPRAKPHQWSLQSATGVTCSPKYSGLAGRSKAVHEADAASPYRALHASPESSGHLAASRGVQNGWGSTLQTGPDCKLRYTHLPGSNMTVSWTTCCHDLQHRACLTDIDCPPTFIASKIWSASACLTRGSLLPCPISSGLQIL